MIIARANVYLQGYLLMEVNSLVWNQKVISRLFVPTQDCTIIFVDLLDSLSLSNSEFLVLFESLWGVDRAVV